MNLNSTRFTSGGETMRNRVRRRVDDEVLDDGMEVVPSFSSPWPASLVALYFTLLLTGKFI